MPVERPALIELCAGGFRWSVSADLRPLLFDADGLRLPEWLRAGQAHIVKQGPHRVVYRVELPGLNFYLKHNLLPDHRAWFRQMVRTSKARKEYDNAVAVLQRDVPTVDPLAIGEQEAWFGAGESYLLTRSLDGTEPLNIFLAGTLRQLPEPRRTQVRQRLARTLGELVARMHDAGILHHDLHAANLLVQLDAEDQVSLHVIDLHSIKVGSSLDWATSRHNLAILNSWFLSRVHRSDRLRFWKAYFISRKSCVLPVDLAPPRRFALLAVDLEQRTWEYNFSSWKRRERRCMKNNRYFHKVRGFGSVGHAVTDLDPQLVQDLLRNPDEPLSRPGVKLLKDSISSTVAELDLVVAGKVRRVIYKRFRVTSWTDPFTSLLRPTPALRSWVHGQRFRERSLPTARPLLVMHKAVAGAWREGYLITEKIENAVMVHEYVRGVRDLPDEARRRKLREQIEEVARTIRCLHERHLSHRDLKAANILVRRWDSPAPDPALANPQAIQNLLHMPEGSVWLIDLVGVELWRSLSKHRRINNLARLNASFFQNPDLTRTDRLRFLRIYLNWGLSGRGDWKNWWRQIDRITQGKIARTLRRGRPLG